MSAMPPRVLGVLGVLGVFVVLLACSSEAGRDPLDPDPPPGDPNATLECERTGYPCTLGGVAGAVLERSLELADSAAHRFSSGSSGAEVLTWIRSQQGVAESQGDAYAVRFRLAEGRPVWVLDEQARASKAGAAAAAVTTTFDRASLVVGMTPATKRALVLSPFAWEFVGFDESPGVAAILGATRGYEGRVEHIANETEASMNVTLAHFTGWGAYDVVHVSSHGKTLCDESGCRAMLTAGRDNRPLDQVKSTWNGKGVVIGKIGDDGHRYISLEADFFLDRYETGVGDAVVFVSACQTLPQGVTDLADAIRGERGVFLGWSAALQSGPGRDAALAFYTHLSETGATVGTAYASLGGLASNIWTDDDGNTVAAILHVTERAAGGDLRIREIVEIEHPQGSGPLSDGAAIRIHGIPGDGQPDTVPWRIRVEGVDADPADFVVRVVIEGLAAQPVTLAAGQSIDDMVWQLSGTVAMGRDLAEDEVLLITATVELPDQGTSSMSATATVSFDPGAWVGDTGYLRAVGEGDSEYFLVGHDLRFEHDADRNAWVLVTGSISWRNTGTTFNASGQLCTFDTGIRTYPLTPGSAHIEIDRSTSPARYSGYGYFEGPVVDVPTSCPDMTLKSTAAGPWFRADLSAHVLSDDGRRMAGDDFLDHGFLSESWIWLFTLEDGP